MTSLNLHFYETPVNDVTTSQPSGDDVISLCEPLQDDHDINDVIACVIYVP